MNRLNVPPEACLAYEDTDQGIHGAREAGMDVMDVREHPAPANQEEDDMRCEPSTGFHYRRDTIVDPGEFRSGLARLARSVAGHVNEDGALRDQCRSRALESALALRLLERHMTTAVDLDALRAYLAGQATGPDGLDRMMAALALGNRRTLPEEDLNGLLALAPDFTRGRKRALLHGLLILLAPADDRPTGEFDWPTEAFALRGLHPWAEVQVTAVKVVLAAATGKLDLVTAADVDRLTRTQRQHGIWEGNVLIHLWVLHALSYLTGHGPVIAAGIARLAPHQRQDGGIPFITNTDTWAAVTGGIALATVGGMESTCAAIRDHVLRQQKPDGGWSVTDIAEVTDVDSISVALQFLQLSGDPAVCGAVEAGWDALDRVAAPDGGYPTYVKGAPSEASMTVAALDALTPQPERHREAISRGLKFVVEHQRQDGTFPPDWSNSRWHTISRAVLMATRADLPPVPGVDQMVDKAVALALTTQHPDGGWGQQPGDPSDPVSTAYGLITVCGTQPDPSPVAAAADYLLSRQRQDGTLPVVPDTIGPRPFIYDVPVIGDIFCLLALAHLNQRATHHDIPTQVFAGRSGTRMTSGRPDQ